MPMVDQDADYYQAHKDDPEEWGEPRSTEKPKKRRLAAMISVRFTPEEEDEIRRAAQSKGTSVSQFIRETALKEARPRPKSSKAPTVPISAVSSTSTGSFGGTSQMVKGNAVIEVPGGQRLSATVLSDQ